MNKTYLNKRAFLYFKFFLSFVLFCVPREVGNMEGIYIKKKNSHVGLVENKELLKKGNQFWYFMNLLT